MFVAPNANRPGLKTLRKQAAAKAARKEQVAREVAATKERSVRLAATRKIAAAK